MTDERLEEIGIQFPYQRNRILLGLMKFHVKEYSEDSLPKIRPNESIDLIRLFDVVAACAKHLAILKCTMDFLQRKDLFGDKAVTPDRFKQFVPVMKKIERELGIMGQRMKILQQGAPLRPPLHINEEAINEIKKKIPFRRQIIRTLWFTGSVFAATALIFGLRKLRK